MCLSITEVRFGNSERLVTQASYRKCLDCSLRCLFLSPHQLLQQFHRLSRSTARAATTDDNFSDPLLELFIRKRSQTVFSSSKPIILINLTVLLKTISPVSACLKTT